MAQAAGPKPGTRNPEGQGMDGMSYDKDKPDDGQMTEAARRNG
jgi:hypothetical protein